MAHGTFGNDTLTASQNEFEYGLFGADILTAPAGLGGIVLSGGQGNDLYNIGEGSGVVVLDKNGSDTINIADDFNEFRFFVTDGRDLLGIDDDGALLLVASFQDPSHRIERWNVGGRSYDAAGFERQLFSFEGYDGRRDLADVVGAEVAGRIRQAILTAQSTEDQLETQALGARFAGDTDNVYRFYNTSNGRHFYTASAEERDLVARTYDQFSFEGPAFERATTGADLVDVHRFYNASTGGHFYTASEAERAQVEATNPAFAYEGVAYRAHGTASAGSEALYRFYNTATQTHFYTASAAERDSVDATLPQYHYEGVAYYVEPLA